MCLRGRGSVVPAICLVVSLALGCAGAGGRRAAPSGEAVVATQGAVAAESRTVVYVGLAGGAVATFHLNLATGTLGRRASVDVGRAPTSLARSVERETLVAVDEATGLAVALAIDAKTGALTPVGRTSAGGASPSGAVVDGTGKYRSSLEVGEADLIRRERPLAPAIRARGNVAYLIRSAPDWRS